MGENKYVCANYGCLVDPVCYACLNSRVKNLEKETKKLLKYKEKATDIIKRYKRALKFYANENNYEHHSPKIHEKWFDNGKTARESL